MGRAGRLAHVIAGGHRHWTHRERAYIVSARKAKQFEQLYAAGWDASPIVNKLMPPGTFGKYVDPKDVPSSLVRQTKKSRPIYRFNVYAEPRYHDQEIIGLVHARSEKEGKKLFADELRKHRGSSYMIDTLVLEKLGPSTWRIPHADYWGSRGPWGNV